MFKVFQYFKDPSLYKQYIITSKMQNIWNVKIPVDRTSVESKYNKKYT